MTGSETPAEPARAAGRRRPPEWTPAEPTPADGGPEVGRLESVFLGGGRQYTRSQVAALAGVPQEQTLRLWRALGFPAVEDTDAVFTDADVAAARVAHGLLESGLIDRAADAAVTRALGHHLSRLAEWQVHVVWTWLRQQPLSTVDEDRAAEVAEIVLPAIEQLQTYVWRRHLAAYARRALAAVDEPDSGHRVVGFADMVGYTSLTRRVDEAELSTVLENFEDVAAATVPEFGGQVVKMIGDEVLFTVEDPGRAADLGLELHARAAGDQRLPQLRVGLAFGRVLRRLGDVYGPVVNIAARLTSHARPGTVLTDTALARELGSLGGFRLLPLRPVPVRGYSRLHPHVLRGRLG